MNWTNEENQKLTLQFLAGLSKVILRPTMARLEGWSAESVRGQQLLGRTQFDLNLKRTRGKKRKWSIGDTIVSSQFGHVAALMVGVHTSFSEVSTLAAAATAYSQALKEHIKQTGDEETTFTDYDLIAACIVVYLLPHYSFEPIKSWFEEVKDEIDEVAQLACIEPPENGEVRIDLVELIQELEQRLDIRSWFNLSFINGIPCIEESND